MAFVGLKYSDSRTACLSVSVFFTVRVVTVVFVVCICCSDMKYKAYFMWRVFCFNVLDDVDEWELS